MSLGLNSVAIRFTDMVETVTKAGVPTYKIFVGESSYGRSFKMAQAGCDGFDCFFLGERLESPAAKGRCTDTGGYISNAEIDEIIALGEVTNQWHDIDSNSDILVYNGKFLNNRLLNNQFTYTNIY